MSKNAKICDRSQLRKYPLGGDTAARQRQRKAEQRARERKDRFARVELRLTDETVALLSKAALLAGDSTKEQAQWLVAGLAQTNLAFLKTHAERAASVLERAKDMLSYREHLLKPGAAFRIHGRTYTHADWMPIQKELDDIALSLMRRRWSKDKALKFIDQATVQCISNRIMTIHLGTHIHAGKHENL